MWIGEHLARRVPAAALRPALGCVMLGSALGVFKKAGVDLSPFVIFGVPLAIGIASYALHRARRPAVAPLSP